MINNIFTILTIRKLNFQLSQMIHIQYITGNKSHTDHQTVYGFYNTLYRPLLI